MSLLYISGSRKYYYFFNLNIRSRSVMSNHILSVATYVATKSLLSPLCRIWEKHGLFINTNIFLNNCLSPHLKHLSPYVAYGDKVGHHWTRLTHPLKYYNSNNSYSLLSNSSFFPVHGKLTVVFNFDVRYFKHNK